MPASRPIAGIAARRKPIEAACEDERKQPRASKLRETINGASPASGAFVEPGGAWLAQIRHHKARQVAQAGERVLLQERR